MRFAMKLIFLPMTSGREPKRFKSVHLSEACDEKMAPSDTACNEQQTEVELSTDSDELRTF